MKKETIKAISDLINLYKANRNRDITVPRKAGKVLLSDKNLQEDLKGVGENDFVMYAYKGEVCIVIQGISDADLSDWSEDVIVEFAKVMKKELA